MVMLFTQERHSRPSLKGILSRSTPSSSAQAEDPGFRLALRANGFSACAENDGD